LNAVVAETQRRVLLVEDEAALARTLRDMLHAEGYQVETHSDGALALDAASAGTHDLILLDVMLPSMDGFEISGSLRRRGINTPIIMLTARDELGDKVGGLRSGADDYLTKPFEAEELLARIEALLRRTYKDIGNDLVSYEFGDVQVDFTRNRLIRKGTPTDLAEQESQLLRYLVRHRGEVVSREALLTEVWGYRSIPFTRTVDVHVAWLRQKIEPNPGSPRYITTVRGKGYRFDG
jgi:two-component system alkaline phosphatase synthesis response regulator PhoP